MQTINGVTGKRSGLEGHPTMPYASRRPAPGHTLSLLALSALALLSQLSCTDVTPRRSGPEGGPEPPMWADLYRALPISNLVDGVVWEAGPWEPHLTAGDQGVSWGNHRAVVVVEATPLWADSGEAAPELRAHALDAVLVTIPWRRRDADPSAKGVIVVDATTGEAVRNVLALRVENASGDLVFQPNPGSSVYHVYYLPWESSGGYYPTISYPTPARLRDAGRGVRGGSGSQAESPSRAQQAGQNRVSWVGLAPDPDPAWEARIRGLSPADLPQGRTTKIQSVNDFHSFFPMEVIATPEEEAAFWDGVARGAPPRAAGGGEEGRPPAWAVVPEHRDYPIRMHNFLPRHWVERPDPALYSFTGQVLRGEAFTFQLGVVSGSEPLDSVTLAFDGFPASWMASLTCFNCGGIDEKGAPFQKAIDIPPNAVQPLWIGARIPGDQEPGSVEGTVTVASANRGSRVVPVSLDVQPGFAPNGGVDEPDLQTRLFWLNSTMGTDPDFIIEPFVPVTVDGLSLSVLGRRVELGPSGLPLQIFSYFTPELTHFAERPEPILARPLALEVVNPAGRIEEFRSSPFDIRQESRGRGRWRAESTSDFLDMTVEGTLEYDGMLDLRVTLVALDDAAVDDIVLPVSLVPAAADYMLGLGRKGGGGRPSVDWRWAVENHQEGVWLGGIHKGLQYVLRDDNYVRPLNTNFYQNQPLNMPTSWYNGGRGGS